MIHTSILVPGGAILGSIEGPRQILTEANKYLIASGREPLFDVRLVGLTDEVRLHNGIYTVATTALLCDITSTDLIIIPALDGDMRSLIESNRAFLPWIVSRYNEGAEVASLCVGAFMLASTGLLNGRTCATHWSVAHEFRAMFPEVQLVEDKIITDEHGMYSSGGAFSYLNLILYLIEKRAGRDVAIFCSKAFQIDYERSSQSPFIVFHGQKDHGDEVIRKVQEYIENNVSAKLTVEQLSSMFAVGRRNLERRFKKATSNTVVEYIQRVKIEAAKMSLESSRDNVNEVMYNVGYTDPKAFRLTFRRITGLSPLQYRNRYQRELRA